MDIRSPQLEALIRNIMKEGVLPKAEHSITITDEKGIKKTIKGCRSTNASAHAKFREFDDAVKEFAKNQDKTNEVAFFEKLAFLYKYAKYNTTTVGDLASKLEKAMTVTEKTEKGIAGTLFSVIIEILNQNEQQKQATIEAARAEAKEEFDSQFQAEVERRLAIVSEDLRKEKEASRKKDEKINVLSLENSGLKGQNKAYSEIQPFMSKIQERRDQKENDNPVNNSFSSTASLSMSMQLFNSKFETSIAVDKRSSQADLANKLGTLRGNMAVGADRANVINTLIKICNDDHTNPEEKAQCAKLALAIIIGEDSVKKLLQDPESKRFERIQAYFTPILESGEVEQPSLTLLGIMKHLSDPKLSKDHFKLINDQVTTLIKIYLTFYKGKQSDKEGKFIDSKFTTIDKSTSHYLALEPYFPDEFITTKIDKSSADANKKSLCCTDVILNTIINLRDAMVKVQSATQVKKPPLLTSVGSYRVNTNTGGSSNLNAAFSQTPTNAVAPTKTGQTFK